MLILSEHSCSSVVPIVKIIMSNFVYVKYSSLLNTLKGNCFDDEQYVYCTNSRGTKARSWSWFWSCCSGLGLGLKNLVLFTSLPICETQTNVYAQSSNTHSALPAA